MHVEIRGAERLSFRERQVVVLKETGQSGEAIARRLGISPATVQTLYSRAKGKGYQVVIILDGDPLALYDPADMDSTDADAAGDGVGDAGREGGS